MTKFKSYRVHRRNTKYRTKNTTKKAFFKQNQRGISAIIFNPCHACKFARHTHEINISFFNLLLFNSRYLAKVTWHNRMYFAIIFYY